MDTIHVHTTDQTHRLAIGSTTLAQAERLLILETVRYFGGNKTRAAQALGVSLKNVYNKLNEYAGRTARRRYRRLVKKKAEA